MMISFPRYVNKPHEHFDVMLVPTTKDPEKSKIAILLSSFGEKQNKYFSNHDFKAKLGEYVNITNAKIELPELSKLSIIKLVLYGIDTEISQAKYYEFEPNQHFRRDVFYGALEECGMSKIDHLGFYFKSEETAHLCISEIYASICKYVYYPQSPPLYSEDLYLSDRINNFSISGKDDANVISEFSILYSNSSDNKPVSAGMRENIQKAVWHSRNLIDMPPNHRNGSLFSFMCDNLKNEFQHKYDCTYSRYSSDFFPAFAHVAGGDNEQGMIHYFKAHNGSPAKKIAIIGKSIMFDTGGLHLKTGFSINGMKCDYAGGVIALSSLRYILQHHSDCNFELALFLPVCSNNIGSKSLKPDSIINSYCGKKIEIRDTDAEGRLTLIDAVSCAETNFCADLIITIATLTGSAEYSYGNHIAVMMNKAAEEQYSKETLIKCFEKEGDRIEFARLTPEDFEATESRLPGVDLVNYPYTENRGHQRAAAFVMSGLKNENIPIIHLDIAGCVINDELISTGRVTGGLIEYLTALLQNNQGA